MRAGHPVRTLAKSVAALTCRAVRESLSHRIRSDLRSFDHSVIRYAEAPRAAYQQRTRGEGMRLRRALLCLSPFSARSRRREPGQGRYPFPITPDARAAHTSGLRPGWRFAGGGGWFGPLRFP